MSILDFSTTIEQLASAYNVRLESLQLESVNSHEYGEKWNAEQHALLNQIKEETETFMKRNNYNCTEHFRKLVEITQEVISKNNIKLTVVSI